MALQRLRALNRLSKTPPILKNQPSLSRIIKKHYSSTSPPKTTRSRLEKLNNKLPKFLQPYTSRLLDAPVSHITAFLLLHELTALLPLIGLTTLFHYTNYLPQSFTEGEWFTTSLAKWSRYAKRKGWIDEDDSSAEDVHGRRDVRELEGRSERWRWVVETATAYAVVKVLLPVRIVGSVWATPWFARVVVLPVGRGLGRIRGK